MKENDYLAPAVSAGEAVKQITALYKSALENGCVPELPSVMLWGPMGVGKTQAVYEIAENLSAATGQETVVTDIRLLLFTPTDLRGLPSVNADHTRAVWLKPEIFDLDPDKIHIIFLDELSTAPPAMQAAAYQIALEKKIGEFTLPEKSFVICVGNRTTDRSVAYRMSKALANRLLHLHICADYDSWYAWAVRHGIDRRVVGYLAFDNSRLAVEPGLEQDAFPTPRSWEFASRLLSMTGKEPKELQVLLSGCVGVSTALEFEKYCEVYSRLPAVADIFHGRCRSYPKKMDELYALTTSMVAHVSQKMDTLGNDDLENASSFASGFPADFAALFFRSILELEGMNLKLMHVPSFVRWMNHTKTAGRGIR